LRPDNATAGWSLERRLHRRLLLALVLAWLLGSGAALLAVQEETDEVLDSALVETGQHLLGLGDAVLGSVTLQGAPAGFAAHDEFVVYQVLDAQGHLRWRSHRAPEAQLAPAVRPGLLNHGAWRVAVLDSRASAYRVLVAEPLAHRAEVLWEAALAMLLPLLALLPVSWLILHLLLRASFRSLAPVQQALRGDAQVALPLQGMPQEWLPLLQEVNAMRARQQMMVEAERAFAGQMAHELRTPLAAARAQVQRLLQVLGPAAPPAQAERAGAVLKQLDRVSALAARLLELARVDAGLALRREPVDLKLLARLVLDEFEHGGQRPPQLHLCEAPALVLGDMDALGIALRNLVHNARLHGGAEANVELLVEPARLCVRDDGPGLDAGRLAQLRQDLTLGQGPQARLGLALVHKIAEQSGALLRLRSPCAGGRGFEASIEWARP